VSKDLLTISKTPNFGSKIHADYPSQFNWFALFDLFCFF